MELEEEYNEFQKVTANHNGHLAGYNNNNNNNKPKTAGRGCFRH
jgi:hypothetical protein